MFGTHIKEAIAECLESKQNPFDHFTAEQVLEAVGDGQFAEMLSNVAHKRMIKGYEFFPSTWDKIVNKPFGSRPNFKENKLIRTEEFSRLDEVTKRKPTDMDTIGEEAGTYRVKTYERGYDINREDIINDDLNQFMKFPQSQGRAASRTIDKFVWDFINDNATMKFDNTALFHANHSNLLTTSPLTATNLATADYYLSSQTDKKNGDILSLQSKYLIVPPRLKNLALRIINAQALAGTANNDANPFSNLQILIVPWLTQTSAESTTDWYLAADPSQIETIQIDFLKGQSTPQTLKRIANTQDGYDFLSRGMAWKTRFEFGGEICDYRWIVKGDAA